VVALVQAGLRDGSVLWFEPGKALTKHELELKYEVYTGNKTTPTGGGGKRVKTGELIIHASATIDALKATILAVRFVGFCVCCGGDSRMTANCGLSTGCGNE
jgi:hypothetical protein